jgi:quinol-cytochrome oxidoreductase complex cytochrome b subunit
MGLRNLSEKQEPGQDVPFFPNVLLAEVSLAFAVIGLLVIFAGLYPLRLGEKFDPTHPPAILEPEWYFMGVYQILKTQGVQPVYGVLLLAGLGIFMVAVPFVDRGSERHPLRRPLFVAVAFFVAVEFLGLTVFGYLSPGRVGSFSDASYTVAFLATNIIAVVSVFLVLYTNRRVKGSFEG